MSRKYCIAFLYTDLNKYSIHVLIAAIQFKRIDIDVHLINIHDFFNLVNSLLTKYDKVIVGISLMTTQLPDLLSFIWSLRRFKTLNSDRVLIIGGGPHVSGDPLGSLKSLGFDYVFIGEAEESLTEFLGNLINGDDLAKVGGIAYIDDDKLVVKNSPKPVNLDDYPPFPTEGGLFNPIEVSRGCPYACKYCQVSHIFGVVMRHRSTTSIINYCKFLISKGIKDLRFISPNILAYGGDGRKLNYSSVIEFLDSMSRLRNLGGRVYLGTFPSEVRPEFIDRDVVKVLKNCVDNKRIAIGAQSGSDKVLKGLNRGHTVDDVINAVNILREYGFGVDVDFIIGLPIEELTDMYETLGFIRKLISLGNVRVRLHTYLPLPGTPLAKYGIKSIPNTVKKELMKLLGRGVIFGDWLKQEELARKIVELMKEGIILS